ncbi:MAG: rod shape-determining protein MreD [Clostridia bacterium]|nr:rod shape-determining protein MreD [Clostridia bacterium]
MRKILTVICLILVFFLIYFLQVNIFSTFTIAGIKPNLFVIYVLFIGLFASQLVGISFGVVIGLLIDFLYGKTIGITAVMLCVIGYLGSYFDKNFSKENKLTIIFMVAGATLIFELGTYFLNSIILNFDREFYYFTKIVLIEIVYNVLLSIIFYPLIQKAGYTIDRNFKKNNILTRYF